LNGILRLLVGYFVSLRTLEPCFEPIGIFKKHHQSDVIGNLQHAVLLRPPQSVVCKDRDPLALTGLGDKQLEVICRMLRIIQLKKERLGLKNEKQPLARAI
jgi:hypothetical protein